MSKVFFFSISAVPWQRAALFEAAINEASKTENDIFFFQSYSSEFFWLDRPISSFLDYRLAQFQDSQIRKSLDRRRIRLVRYPKGHSNPKENLTDEDRVVGFQETISKTRDSSPCTDHLKRTISHYARLHSRAYLHALDFLSSNKPDLVYIFNGRFYRERAIWRAAETLGIRIHFVERFSPSWNDRYFIFTKPVHDIDYRCSVIDDYWKTFCTSKSKSDAISMSTNWFSERIIGQGQRFTARQNLTFDSTLHNKVKVTFFHSSEDELFTTSLGASTWPNQISFVTSLFQELTKLSNVQFIVRLHPNLVYKSRREKIRWQKLLIKLKGDNFTLIMPESPINTYDLLSKSDFIITFGSTIGVEASYFCKPSILASNAFHENLQIVKRVHTMQDIVDILNSKPNSSQLRSSYENALKYGLFYSNGGIHFRFLKKADLKEQDPSFAFENVRIGSWRIISFIRMIEGKFFDFLAPILPSGCNCNLP